MTKPRRKGEIVKKKLDNRQHRITNRNEFHYVSNHNKCK